MKGTVFAVALNHQSQRAAWAEAFEKAPYNAPPKTAVWFIKPHNTVIRAGEPIHYPAAPAVRHPRGRNRSRRVTAFERTDKTPRAPLAARA